MNLKIKDGEKLAIVGENGSGKSTFAKILLGLYRPQSGAVRINGINLDDIKKQVRYGSACFQDYVTYALSVRNNVSLGNTEKQNCTKDILHAIDMSHLERNLFNNDIDTSVTRNFDPDGVVLSIGQSQKLSLARSFLFERGLLVLDGPSASLDVLTENEVFESTLRLMRNRTTIVITHRLVNVVNCDRIVYLESGKICEEGSHEELMKRQGKYAKLFSIQASKYLT